YLFENGKMPPDDQIHQYLIDGIGEDFLPSTAWLDYVDEVIPCDDKTAYSATMEVARKEGIFGGSSSGAAAAVARQVAQREGEGSLVVTLFPDSGERYLSKLNERWMREKGLLD
ncbi:MAG TPA: pyridoxal-phosphate dependent enzyme, partial [Thermoanaerobaculia bacterium]|nr:pyridoxal-phosphate dependent enzyme [Thermoanaerobaculia bacterium]